MEEAAISSLDGEVNKQRSRPEQPVDGHSFVVAACKNLGRRYLPLLAFLAHFSTQGCGGKVCTPLETATCERMAKIVGLRHEGCTISDNNEVNCETSNDNGGGAVNPERMNPCPDSPKKEECRGQKKDCFVFPDILDKIGLPVSICIATKTRPEIKDEKDGPEETATGETPVEGEKTALPEENSGLEKPPAETVRDGGEPEGAEDKETEGQSVDAVEKNEPVSEGGPESGPEAAAEPDLMPEAGPESGPEATPEPQPEPDLTDQNPGPVCSATPTGDPDIKWWQQLNTEATDPLARGCYTDATGQSCGDLPNGVRHSPIDQAMCRRYGQPGITPRAMIWTATNSAAMIRFIYHKSEAKITLTRFFRALGRKNPGGTPQIITGSEQSLNIQATTYDYGLHQPNKPQWKVFFGTWPSSGSGKPDDVGAPIACALSPTDIQQGADSCVIGAEFEVK